MITIVKYYLFVFNNDYSCTSIHFNIDIICIIMLNVVYNKRYEKKSNIVQKNLV